MHKEEGQKHTETESGESHISALNLECLTLNPRKHICTYGKVVLEHANEAQLCSTKLKKKRWCVSKSVTLLLCYTNNYYSSWTTHLHTKKGLIQHDLLGTTIAFSQCYHIYYLHTPVSRKSNSSVIPQMVTRRHCLLFPSYLLSTRVEEITQSDNVTMIQLSHNLELSVLK